MRDTTITATVAAHSHHVHHDKRTAERRTSAVRWITLAATAPEITAGWWNGSMALLADAHRFAFGTWHIERQHEALA